MLKNGADKEKIKEFVSDFYDVSMPLSDIKKHYKLDASCENTVPPAIVAFYVVGIMKTQLNLQFQ